MMTNWYMDRGFLIQIRPVFESAESRLARGDYRLKVVAYYFNLWMPYGRGHKKMRGESDEYPSIDIALDVAGACVDALLDTL